MGAAAVLLGPTVPVPSAAAPPPPRRRPLVRAACPGAADPDPRQRCAPATGERPDGDTYCR